MCVCDVCVCGVCMCVCVCVYLYCLFVLGASVCVYMNLCTSMLVATMFLLCLFLPTTVN